MLQFCRILLLIIFLSPVTRVAAEQLRLTGVNFSNHGSTKIAFQLSGAAHYRFFTLTNPNRLVVDFIDTRLSQAFVQPDPNHPLIQTIRSGTRNAHDLRVVLELKSAVESAGNLLNQANGSELQLDLVSKYQPAIQSAGLSNLNPVTSLSINKKPALDIKETKETVSFVKPVNIINTPAKGRDITVAIDAGHGGKDVGAQGNNGTQEKDVVFAIAKRLESLVNSQPGLHAVMIRKGDYFVKLNERVRIAEEAKADLFVSIHADAFNDSSANGASVYTLANKGASSAGARWLADSENASDQVADGGSAEKNDTLASVLHDLTQTAAKEASQNVGSKVLRNVKTVGHLHRTAVQKAGFVVLKSQNFPSILVETAFISNPEEEDRLNSRAYQDKMANAVFSGIMAHFHQYAPANTLIAQLSKSGKSLRLATVKEAIQPEATSHNPTTIKVASVAPTYNKSQHIINRGETLLGIAQHYGVSMRAIRLANNMNDGNVKVGSVLTIPTNG